MSKCPKCGSAKIRFYSYLGANVLKCSGCGFDEKNVYDVYPEEKASQKEKGRYSPYKTGGSRRAAKK